jgi:hypothetical protein
MASTPRLVTRVCGIGTSEIERELLPIRVPFHSIMGDRRLGGGTESSDGVVLYSSSHLDGAESELIVLAGHTVFSSDAAVNEIKRILHENVRQNAVNAGIAENAEN